MKENREELLSFLKGKVFHLTTKAAYKGILKSGMVCNNKDGQFNINCSSKNSFGRLSGYVCLFDLRGKSDDAIDDILYKYNFLGPSWFKEDYDNYYEWNLAYMIFTPEHYEQLIPYEKAIENHSYSGEGLVVIPHAEAWVIDHVPIEWFYKIYLVHIKVLAPKPGTYAKVLYDLEPDLEGFRGFRYRDEIRG